MALMSDLIWKKRMKNAKKEILKTTLYYASYWLKNLSLQAIITCQEYDLEIILPTEIFLECLSLDWRLCDESVKKLGKLTNSLLDKLSKFGSRWWLYSFEVKRICGMLLIIYFKNSFEIKELRFFYVD